MPWSVMVARISLKDLDLDRNQARQQVIDGTTINNRPSQISVKVTRRLPNPEKSGRYVHLVRLQ